MNVTQESTFANISATIHLGHMAAHVFMATDKGPTCEPVKVGYAMRLLPYINKFMLLRLFLESIREYETLEQMLLSNGYKGIRPSGMCRHLSLPSCQIFFLVLIRTSL